MLLKNIWEKFILKKKRSRFQIKKKITENFKATAEGVNSLYSFVFHWKLTNKQQRYNKKYLNSYVFWLKISHEKVFFELKLLSKLQDSA